MNFEITGMNFEITGMNRNEVWNYRNEPEWTLKLPEWTRSIVWIYIDIGFTINKYTFTVFIFIVWKRNGKSKTNSSKQYSKRCFEMILLKRIQITFMYLKRICLKVNSFLFKTCLEDEIALESVCFWVVLTSIFFVRSNKI